MSDSVDPQSSSPGRSTSPSRSPGSGAPAARTSQFVGSGPMSEPVDPQRSSPSRRLGSGAPAAGAAPHDDETKALLEECMIERKEARKDVELYRSRCIADKTELYQLLAFYSVFQGVVFNTVASSTELTCQTSMLPVFVTCLAYVAAAASVHYKLTDYRDDKQKLLNGEDILAYVTRKKKVLEGKGNTNYKRDMVALERKLQQDKQHLTKFYWIVIIFLSIFSLTIMACCVLLRCWDLDKQTIMLCFFKVCYEKHNVTISIHKF